MGAVAKGFKATVCKKMCRVYGEHSSVGRTLDCGSRGRGFNLHCPPQKVLYVPQSYTRSKPRVSRKYILRHFLYGDVKAFDWVRKVKHTQEGAP